MSSPQSTTAHEGSDNKNLEQITFRFCAECSNMLYPKEDEDSHKLQFTCRTCQYTEEAVSTCVFRNVLNNAAGETAGVTQDVGSDPTVGAIAFPNPSTSHTMLCFCCGAFIACRSCGGLFCKPASAPSETTETTATTATASTTNDVTFSPSLRDLDDLDLYPYDYDFEDVTNTAGMFGDDCYGVDNDYEFMDGCEEVSAH
ncbi:hypothetical protein Sste5346_006709 [Sporothrix stenoceras]|uniref:DNA-directed RNA polymerase II subunit RPB9-like zinc ribbon domain-containing protein n=1 Tax=Sporothrix stenoceras TaxID=5173 RepID=A0ABR3YXR7_9PEZI